jgi:hypothetical protein
MTAQLAAQWRRDGLQRARSGQAGQIAALLAAASGLTAAHRRQVAFAAGIRSAS